MQSQPAASLAPGQTFTAFAGTEKILSGGRREVSQAIARLADGGCLSPILVFDDATGAQVELDISAIPEASQPSLGRPSSVAPAPHPDGGTAPQRRSPGRPRLGVVGREVTLLPRHWEWLSAQPGGASVALRKLVDQARRENASRDRARGAQEAAFRFMSAIAGNEPGFEEASRALFAGDAEAFGRHTAPWPFDVREYARRLAAAAFEPR